MDWLWLFAVPITVICIFGSLLLLLRERGGEVVTDLPPDTGMNRLSRLLGYEPADLQGAFSLESVHPADWSEVSRIWAELVEQPGNMAKFRYRERQADNTWRWVDATGANLRNEPSVGAVVINRRDITDEIETQLRLEDQVAIRTRELESLYRADAILRRSLNLNDVLQALVDVAADMLGMPRSAVFVFDEHSGRMALGAVRGFERAAVEQLQAAFDDGIAASLLQNRAPVALPEALAVPVRAGDQLFGILCVAESLPRGPAIAEPRPLVALAERAGLAIENARLYGAARDKAALEERQKLARELHDSVSQALYAIALNTTAAQRTLESDPARVGRLLGDVLHLTETGLVEMRALIFELRPESLATEGLVSALEKQSAAVVARHRLEIHTTLDTEPNAPLSHKEVVYRVAQEALHNIAKHARASHVHLNLEVGVTEMQLSVRDDGHGFDSAAEYPGHLGLRSMRERAAAVGGMLRVESHPGHGTRVSLRVPLQTPELGVQTSLAAVEAV